MTWHDDITQSPDVLGGKPVIKGTRTSVELLLKRMAGGFTESDLLAACPQIRPEHIRAALAYAAEALANDERVFLEPAAA